MPAVSPRPDAAFDTSFAGKRFDAVPRRRAPTVRLSSGATTLVHVTPALFGVHGIFGGGERYVHSLAQAVEAAAPGRFRQRIVGLSDRPAARLREGAVDLELIPADDTLRPRPDWTSRRIWSALEGADLVHVHQPFRRWGASALVAAADLGAAIVATDLGAGMPPPEPRNHPIRLADRILAVSQFSRELLGTQPAAPIDVVIGPVSAALLDAPLRRGDRRGALYVGRILPHKGIDRLIRAAPHDLPVTIAGRPLDRNYAEHLRGLARGKAVTFIHDARDEDLPALYGAAAAHVAPSVVRDHRGVVNLNSELMGITTLEALASGTAAVVARTCSLPELIAGAPVGEVFADETELRSILERVRDGSFSAAHPPEACRDYAKARFAPAVVGALAVETYEKALEARSAR